VLGHLATPAARAPWLLRPDGSGTGVEVRLFAPSGELAGTGYTTWSFESLAVPEGGTGAPVAVGVRNTGARRGREVVQLYASRPGSAVQRPLKWLVGFAAVDADPGACVTAEIWVPERALQHWTERGWALEPGTVVLAAGPSSASLPLTAEVAIP